MIRILIFLLSVLFVVGAVTLFASFDSKITGEVFGWKFDGHPGWIIGGLFFLFFAVIYVTHLVKNLMAMPAKIKAKEREARRSRGVSALTRGLEAVAAGDASGAAHHAKVARSHLDDVALTRLLTAQSAQISGDEDAARDSFSGMLEAPETEFLGLKGLYLQAMKAGDQTAAQGFADRAFRLRPNARWAFDSVFDLGLQRGAWRETREAVAQARRNNVIAADKADRAAAVLLAADAYAAFLSGDKAGATGEAKAALKLASGLTPAALLASRLFAEAQKPGKAAKTIEAAFAVAPHPALIKAYELLYTDESSEKRAENLRKLADINSASREAILLKARADNLTGNWAEAIEAIEPLLAEAPTAAEFSLIADAMAGRDGADAARPWLERAAYAPRDPRPGADGEFHLTREGWAQMVREYMEHQRLSPPPLEEISLGMSADEIKLLIAPPIAEEPPDETPDEAAASGDAPPILQSEKVADPVVEAPAAAAAADDEDDHIHNDEEAERAAAAARNVS